MAFVGLGDDEPVDVFEEAARKVEALTRVTDLRDQIVIENEQTPIKIFIAMGVGMWVIYHFLIKR